MASDDAILEELRLTREQHWVMHRVLVERIDQTNARIDVSNEKLGSIDHRLGRVEVRLDRVEGRLDRVEGQLESLAEATANGFAQVVEHGNRLQLTFERFVELSLEERRRLGVKGH
ncbi:MAG: hypothetical protein U1E65_27095 [Myxococcota bacterium]